MYDKITKKVGNTPLIKWNDIYLKMEMFNPSGSIKDRPAFNMLQKLIDDYKLKENDTIICPSSGNMGISLAYLGKYFSLNIIIVIPNNSTKERINILKSLDAKIIFSDGLKGMKGSIELAKELANKYNYYYFDQFSSDDNYQAHYQTIKEIIEELHDVDTIICGIGTGGTYIGISKYVKDHNLNIDVIGYEPLNVPLINNYLNNTNLDVDMKIKGIPGIGSTIISDIILNNIKYVEKIKIIDPTQIRLFWKNLLEQNLNVGISGAASIYLALKWKKISSNKKIVAIIPDGTDRYLSDINV